MRWHYRVTPKMRWHYRDPLLVWLLPLAYVCHLLEEWFGGFTRWIGLLVGAPLPSNAFIAINAGALLLMIIAAHATTRRESNGWMGIAIATILFVNGIAHIAGTLAFGSYSPGLVTSVILYLPLAQLVLLRAWSQAERRMVAQGFAAGIMLHAAVFLLVLGVTR